MTRLAALLPLLLLASPARASLPEEQAVRAYVRARAADAGGDLSFAARSYADALAAQPGDPTLALRAFRQAMAAGDRRLALDAARMLEVQGKLTPDGRLLLVAEAFTAKDWKRAAAGIAQVEQDRAFAFLAPVLRGWLTLGQGRGDPLAPLQAEAAGASPYAAEHRAFLLLATRRYDEGLAALRTQLGQPSGRTVRLKLAAAATLQRRGKDKLAATLLDGDDPALGYARARVAARRDLPAPVLTPAEGLAELFARLSVDINRERVTPLALTMARLATFLAPDNAETWLATAELLAAADMPQAGLSALGHIAPDDPFVEAARVARFQLLVRQGAQAQALTEAQAVVARADATSADWVRVGDILSELDRHGEAAEAYGRALTIAEARPEEKDALWTFYLLRGGALEQAKNWAAAKPDLERAAALAPEQPVVLNYLGYAQLERRENLDTAETLIARAARLKPDDASITDSLGWAYYVRGKIPAAVRTLEQAVSAEPGDATMNEHLGDAYWTAGRRVEARYAWRAALVSAADDAAKRIRQKIDAGLTTASAAP
ncbi:tetratricopeptide repeat protein [Sphingomonas jatrophae]|uniref:Tetratricopeptide repeat-containing protein n=1 Tax=Sphingomonas jatrophae TaxID=1166337 RepID=A0A1I6JJ20_9SPHN|nr:tetratricopeptide repeat protein [Sphingomonas jatrophae]SFR78894.1 Tetratricopeptide repeat-containing protein [Sphingomonas jatrophae]